VGISEIRKWKIETGESLIAKSIRSGLVGVEGGIAFLLNASRLSANLDGEADGEYKWIGKGNASESQS
jgi:hypothetical protein